MNVGAVCTREVVAIAREALLDEAARLMREHHVGALVVTQDDPGGPQVAGIVTDRDLAIEVLARGVDGSRVPVSRLLSDQVFSIAEEADIAEAISTMQAAGVRRLLVRNAGGQLAGVLSFDDVLQACAAQISGLAAVVRKGIEQESARRARLAAPPATALRVPAMGTAGWLAAAPERSFA